jgi:hypothetical protein
LLARKEEEKKKKKKKKARKHHTGKYRDQEQTREGAYTQEHNTGNTHSHQEPLVGCRTRVDPCRLVHWNAAQVDGLEVPQDRPENGDCGAHPARVSGDT